MKIAPPSWLTLPEWLGDTARGQLHLLLQPANNYIRNLIMAALAARQKLMGMSRC